MGREQIAQLEAEGFTIGAHTVDHPKLRRLSSWSEVRRQIEDSCRVVQEITGRQRVPFAFPFNGLDLSRDKLAALRNDLGSIDLMYDTNNCMKDRPFIVNRICCDTPAGSRPQWSNMSMLLARAHAFEPLRNAARQFRRIWSGENACPA